MRYSWQANTRDRGSVRTAFVILVIALIAALSAPRGSAAASDPAEPLAILRNDTLVLAADPRFSPADRGTIEFTLALNPEQLEPAGKACIAAHGGGDGPLDWRLLISGDRKSWIFHSDSGELTVPRNPDHFGFEHLAFVTAGGMTRAITGDPETDQLNDQGVPGKAVPMRYLPATPEGLRLDFGCSSDAPGRVWISSFRIWDTALSADDLQYTKKFSGFVTGRPDLQQSLLAYSVFTRTAKEIRLTGPAIHFTPFKGATGGNPFFLRRPQRQELSALYYWGVTGDSILADIRAEYDDPALRKWAMNSDPDPALDSLPTVTPQANANPDEQRADILLKAAQTAALASPADAGKTGDLRDAFFAARRTARGVAFGVQTKDPKEPLFEAGGVFTQQPEVPNAARFALSLADGERLTRLTGLATNRGICFWSVESTNIMRPNANSAFCPSAPANEIPAHLEAFGLAIPPGARLEGIAGRRDDNGIHSLALAYSWPKAADKDLMTQIGQGVWIDRDHPFALRESFDTEMPNGSYQTEPVYRFRYNTVSKQLLLYADMIESHGAYTMNAVYTKLDTNQWASPDDPAYRVILFDNGVRLEGRDDGSNYAAAFGGRKTLVRPDAYPVASNDQLPWAATFSLDHRPNGVEANFRGYLPANMIANNLEATTGAYGKVFSMPDAASRDYFTTGSRVVVPFGLQFRIDSIGSERSQARKLTQESEMQSSWTVGLGVHVGIPLVASFDADTSHQESLDTVSKYELGIVEDRATVTHYALVLDPAKMPLSPEFRARVEALRALLRTGQPIDWPAFFNYFGTHFPNAVTYGGMAWAETEVQSSYQSTSKGTVDKTSESADLPLDEGIDVGLKANTENAFKNTVGDGLSLANTNYGTYGGSFSKGGGWSVQRGEELPVLLDLRPIDNLLGPAFFDDMVVNRDLRAAMHQAYLDFNAATAAAEAAQHPWAAKVGADLKTPE